MHAHAHAHADAQMHRRTDDTEQPQKQQYATHSTSTRTTLILASHSHMTLAVTVCKRQRETEAVQRDRETHKHSDIRILQYSHHMPSTAAISRTRKQSTMKMKLQGRDHAQVSHDAFQFSTRQTSISPLRVNLHASISLPLSFSLALNVNLYAAIYLLVSISTLHHDNIALHNCLSSYNRVGEVL